MNTVKRKESGNLKIPLSQKAGLILLGIFLFLVILELSLRLAGFTILALQEYRNRLSLRNAGTYRIMCLGESTTSGQYPVFLEEILNSRNAEVKFSVIDKGVGGINTSCILANLERNLDRYHPDMVVTMMGINDAGPHIPYEARISSKVASFFRSLKVYKLSRLIWMHLSVKSQSRELSSLSVDDSYLKNGVAFATGIFLGEAYAESVPTEESLLKALQLDPGNLKRYFRLSGFYRSEGRFSDAEAVLLKAIDAFPHCDGACMSLGRLYCYEEKYAEAEGVFRKVIARNPKMDGAYVELALICARNGDFPGSEAMFKKALEINPKNADAYSKLAELYEHQNRFAESEAAYKKALGLDSHAKNTYIDLMRLYRRHGNFPEAGRLATDICSTAYLDVACVYWEAGKYSAAEGVLMKAVEMYPDDDRPYGELSVLYDELGRMELARQYARKADYLRLKYYNPVTRDNYHKLKMILDSRGIRLVCVQYPMRSIRSLKRIFEGSEDNIIFVDNEKLFSEAIRFSSHREYFLDMFGGDFGHCTEKGNKLLAENIANTILKEAFGK